MRYITSILTILIYVSGIVMGQNNPLDIFNIVQIVDENEILLNDGDIIQVVYAGADQMIDPPVMNVGQINNGQPTGDDSLLMIRQIGANVPPGGGSFFFTITAYPNHNQGFPATGDSIYVRVFNDDNLANATYYGDAHMHYISNQLGDSYVVQLSGNQTGDPLSTTAIEKSSGSFPQEYRLNQNYPNPFNPATNIRIEVPLKGKEIRTSLNVYDMMGREVRQIVDDYLSPGIHSFTWNGRNDGGELAASGAYFLEMKNSQFYDVKRMFLLK